MIMLVIMVIVMKKMIMIMLIILIIVMTVMTTMTKTMTMTMAMTTCVIASFLFFGRAMPMSEAVSCSAAEVLSTPKRHFGVGGAA